jgi:hypothetical protein
LSRSIEASLDQLSIALNETGSKLNQFVNTLREWVRLLEERHIIKTGEPEDEIIN